MFRTSLSHAKRVADARTWFFRWDCTGTACAVPASLAPQVESTIGTDHLGEYPR